MAAGLAIARGFIEAMKGTITAANRYDRSGAVFTIRFPARADVRTLEKLVDSVNITTQDNHMWMVPFTADGDTFVKRLGDLHRLGRRETELIVSGLLKF